MTHPTPRPELAPEDLAARLDLAVLDAPPLRPLQGAVAAGRGRLRRRRAGQAALGLAATGAAAAAVLAVLPAGSPAGRDLSVATGGTWSDAQVAERCLATDNIASWVRGTGMRTAQLQQVMGRAEVMTRADTGQEVLATVRAEDGSAWGECFLPYGDRATYKHAISVFRTDVAFPRTVVDGVAAYEPQDESDPRLWGTDGSPAPGISVPCEVDVAEETQAYRDAQAQCDSFLVTWVDRRPAEVAGARVANPDGTTGRADVHDGYVSYAYAAPMTRAVAERLRSGDTRVGLTFLAADGSVLARGDRTGPDEKGVTVANFPTLAWWLRTDR